MTKTRCGTTIVGGTMLSAVALGVPLLWPLPVRLLYNASHSMPRGWYLAGPPASPAPDHVVLLRLAPDTAVLAAQRGYLPVGVPLLKRIAAVAPQTVCQCKGQLRIDGVPVGAVRPQDGAHRPLPVWAQCRALHDGEVFVLGDARALSFDSRYFGPVDASALIASAWPLWTWETPS